jgi:hypothetical protein
MVPFPFLRPFLLFRLIMTTPTRRPAPPAAAAQTAPARPAVEVITPDQYADRRSEPRTPCDARGAMLFLSSYQILNCRILDQSASGARVSMENLDHIPAEIWLIDLDGGMVKRGSSAWSMANRMGLKFNFIQKMTDDGKRPAKVPPEVFDAWVRLSKATGTPDEDPDDDVLYFD